jgi:hypothetical protein
LCVQNADSFSRFKQSSLFKEFLESCDTYTHGDKTKLGQSRRSGNEPNHNRNSESMNEAKAAFIGEALKNAQKDRVKSLFVSTRNDPNFQSMSNLASSPASGPLGASLKLSRAQTNFT